MITCNLFEVSPNAILGVLGNLPTSLGAYPLFVDLKQQTDSQSEKKKRGDTHG